MRQSLCDDEAFPNVEAIPDMEKISSGQEGAASLKAKWMKKKTVVFDKSSGGLRSFAAFPFQLQNS